MRYLSIFLFCWLATTAFSQDQRLLGKAQRSFHSTTLETIFTDYTVVSVPMAGFRHFAAGADGEFRLHLDFEGLPAADLLLKPNALISDKYFTTEALPGGGTRKVFDKPAVYPFLGYTAGKAEDGAALTVAQDFLFGFYKAEGRTFFIEPLADFEKGYPANYFLVYDVSAVKPKSGLVCGSDEVAAEAPVQERTDSNRPCQALEVEIAIANDNTMVTGFGGIPGATNHNIGVINSAQKHWDNEFNETLVLTVVTQYFPPNLTSEPWPASDDRDVLLPFFQTWAEGGGFGTSDYDLGHWRTRRNVYHYTLAGKIQIGGATYTNWLCGEYRYSIFSEPAGALTADEMATATSHEMGHSFGCSHTPTGIMGSTISSSNEWHPTSIATINNRITTATCLEAVSCPIPGSIPLPTDLQNICTNMEECYTYVGNPCIYTFQVTTSDPNLQITVNGLTICLKSLVKSQRVARVQVTPLDRCGNPPSPEQPGILWTIYIDADGCPPELQGESEDRTQATVNTAILISQNNDFVNILDPSPMESAKDIRLFDLMGREVFRQQSKDGDIRIPLSGLPQGLLVARVSAGARSTSAKIYHF